MGKLKDLIGQKFGRWTVIARSENNKENRAMWLCRCECGNEKIVVGKDLREGKSLSCGCLKSEILKKIKTKHGKSNFKLLYVYYTMKGRCYNKNDIHYKYYGERGIIICKEWLDDFKNFYTWAINNGYQEGLSIDRIDNNKGYFPENCRWVTQKEQCRNTRKNHIVTYNGKTQCLSAWAEELGIKRSTLQRRLRVGWSIEKALTTLIKQKNK